MEFILDKQKRTFFQLLDLSVRRGIVRSEPPEHSVLVLKELRFLGQAYHDVERVSPLCTHHVLHPRIHKLVRTEYFVLLSVL